MTSEALDKLLASKTPGFTLPQAFHLDPEVYQLELGRILAPKLAFCRPYSRTASRWRSRRV